MADRDEAGSRGAEPGPALQSMSGRGSRRLTLSRAFMTLIFMTYAASSRYPEAGNGL